MLWSNWRLRVHVLNHFSKLINLRVYMHRFTLTSRMLCSIVLHLCVQTLRTVLIFSKTINLRGHMPRFTLKMNVFPSISRETPKMCVETPRTVLISPRQSICGVTCLSLVEKFMFPTYVLGNTINVCWNPSEQGFFSQMIDLRGHMPRFTLKMNIFPSISWETP